MTTPLPPTRPLALSELEPGHPALGEAEVAALWRLERFTLGVAPLRLVVAAAEERFYRLNNLPQQLSDLFAGLNLADPDEDEIEELAPEAEAILGSHYLLDEFIDLFYQGLEGLPATVRLRRPGEAPGRTAARGRPVLLALKQLWADEWAFDRLLARLGSTHSVALSARPVLIQPPGLEPAPSDLTERASELLGQEVVLSLDPTHGITRVQQATTLE